MMNFWIPAFDKWHNGFNESGMPWHAQYDYVEYWEYVPENEHKNDGTEFMFTWRDDFDEFDDSRWRKSNHWSFNENLTIFMES